MAVEQRKGSVYHGSILESLLKGIFLGSAVAVCFRNSDHWMTVLSPIIGFVLLSVALLWFARKSNSASRRGVFSYLVAALDCSVILCGLAAFGVTVGRLLAGVPFPTIFLCTMGGSIFGVFLFLARSSSSKWALSAFSWAVPITACGAIAAADLFDSWAPNTGPFIAIDLFLCTVLLAFLVLIGEAEESDAEVGMVCAGLAASLAALNLPGMGRGFVVLVPVLLYVIYFARARNGVLSIKHVLRGLDREQSGDKIRALEHFHRAAEVSPQLQSAEEGKWRVHKRLSLQDFAQDDKLSALVDPKLCLERASRLIDQIQNDPSKTEEALALLQIAASRRQDFQFLVEFHKIRLFLALNRVSDAVTVAETVMSMLPRDCEHLPENEADAIFQIWKVTLTDERYPRLNFDPRINHQRLLNAVAVIESRLKRFPVDRDAQELKSFLYSQLGSDHLHDSTQDAGSPVIPWLDYGFCRDLAQGLMQDPAAFSRAIELLTIAQRGLPDQRLAIFQLIAQLCEHCGKVGEAQRWRHSILEIGHRIGHKLLAPTEQDVFFKTTRYFAEMAEREGDLVNAIRHYQVYAQSSASGIDTLRTLVQLLEQQGDILSALRYLELAFQFSLSDQTRKNWLIDKRRLYEKIKAEQLRERRDEAKSFLDFAYCLEMVEELIQRGVDFEEVQHFLQLIQLGGEEYQLRFHYLSGRALYRAGQRERAVAEWDKAIALRPPKRSGESDELAFYSSCKMRGDVSLYELDDPHAAVRCFELYKDYVKSGADTLLKLAQAYEQIGELARARKWYDMVLVYPAHPAATTARESLKRIGVGQNS